MAGVSPWHINIPKPKPLQNPFHIANTQGGDVVSGAMPQPYAAPAPVAAAPPPPPDFNALTLADPQYITGQADAARQNQLAMDQLLKGFKGQAQGYQDNANAHGALFSGAAVNAQRSAAQGYADQSAQQAQNLQSGTHNLYNSVWNRLLQQLAGGS